jgi:hypothetical protein
MVFRDTGSVIMEPRGDRRGRLACPTKRIGGWLASYPGKDEHGWQVPHTTSGGSTSVLLDNRTQSAVRRLLSRTAPRRETSVHIGSLTTLSAVLLLSLAAPAAASPPASDRQPDAVGDVVRTYADGQVSTGFGRSDIRSIRLHSIRIGGAGKAVDVVVHLTNVDRRMLKNHVHLTVRFINGNGHIGRTVSDFSRVGTSTTITGLHGINCVSYPHLSRTRDTIAISPTDDCWPVAKSVRVQALFRYDFTPKGRARDFGRAGPIAIP